MAYKKKIVILGAGFGGIKAAFSLYKKLRWLGLLSKYELVLIDRNSYHTYTPMLYEIATTSKHLANQIDLKSIATVPLETIFQGEQITLLQKTVTELDLINGDIHCQDGYKQKFDYLVLALGSEINYFNIPGLKENSLALKSFLDAVIIRDAIWSKVESQPEKKIKIVVGGGGSTGIELAGEIKSWVCELEEELGRCNISVGIIEASPTVLFGFDKRIVNRITRRLKEIEINLMTDEIIERVEPGKIFLKSKKEADFDILIWSGGVKSVSLTRTLPLKKEERGRVVADGEMECLPQTEDLKLYGKIYGLGDAICFYDSETNRPVPLVAEAAIKQAKIVAHNIIEDIKAIEGVSAKSRHKKYWPRKYDYVISVGGKYAVARWGPLVFWGFPGWVLKGLVELYYLLFNVLPPFQAFKIWVKGLWIFMKNDRLG